MGSRGVRARGVYVGLACVLAACGGGGIFSDPPAGGATTNEDAGVGPVDAGVDASEAAPASGGLATLRVASTAGPVKNVEVYFHSGSGSPLGVVKTDANGVASRVVDPMGSESATIVMNVLSAAQDVARLVTFVGITPGDDLFVPYPEPQSHGVVTADLAYHPDAQQYEIHAGTCYAHDATPTLDVLHVYPQCRKGSNIPLLALGSRQGDLDDPSLYSVKTGTTFIENGTVAVSGFPPWTESTSFTAFHLLNMPASTYKTRLAVMLEMAGVLAHPRRRDGFGPDFLLRALPGAADAVHVEVLSPRSTGAEFGDYGLIARRDSTGQGLVEIDMEPLPPPVTDLVLTGTAAAPQLAFGRGPATANEVATLGRIDWYAGACTWTLVAPPGTTSLATPTLPLAASPCLSKPLTIKVSSAAVVDTDTLTGYASAKAAWRMLDTYALGAVVAGWARAPLPKDGHVWVAGASRQ